MKLQIVDYYIDDFNDDVESDSDDNNDSDEEYKPEIDNSQFKIIIFGRQQNGKTVTVNVTDFPTFFYVKVPMTWKDRERNIFETYIRGKMPRALRDSFTRTSFKKSYVFRGFNDKKSNFIRLVFKNMKAMKNVMYTFTSKDKKPKKINIPGIGPGNYFPLFESNISPLLRFIHLTNIKACGNIIINKKDYIESEDPQTTSNVEIITKWNHIKPDPDEYQSPFKILAYDIECDSSHGDFPLPQKDYTKLAKQVVETYELLVRKVKYMEHNRDKEKFYENILKWAFRRQLGITEIPYSFIEIDDLYTKSQNYRLDGKKSTLEHLIKRVVDESICHTKEIIDKKKTVTNLQIVYDRYFPALQGDPIIQIGSCFQVYGENAAYRKHLLSLKNCAPIDGVEISNHNTEKSLLNEWCKLIHEENPDIICGYNIFGFDMPYIFKRGEELGIDGIRHLGRLETFESELEEKQGKIKTEFVDMPGRIQVDIMKIVNRDFNLGSYKLDAVSANFIRGKVKDFDYNSELDRTEIKTDNTIGLNIGNYVQFIVDKGYDEDRVAEGKKFIISEKTNNSYVLEGNVPLDKKDQNIWCLGKDDISPQDIFACQKGTDMDRAVIGKYCIMDVVLCLELLSKLQMIGNNIGMGNVCNTPLSWIFMRGQGVKILSLVSKEARLNDYLLPVLVKEEDDDEKYEGAIVLDPTPGIYLDEPVSVLDYASLYPSSMISVNICHTSIVMDDKYLGDSGAELLKEKGYTHHDVKYPEYDCEKTAAGAIKSKTVKGYKTVRFVQFPDEKKGIIPNILMNLLKQRKTTRKKIPHQTFVLNNGDKHTGLVTDEDDNIIKMVDTKGNNQEFRKDIVESRADTYSQFQKNILDGLQLAYKVTANSLYGQVGAKTSAIYLKELAASTTATGREQLYIAKDYCQNPQNFPMVLENGETIYLENKVVYGDTDSVFVKYDCRYPDGSKMTGKDALKKSIDLSLKSQEGIKLLLKKPQDLEYEKTFLPFVLITKKRYTGNKYEFDPNKCKLTSMGLVTKRRDNAPIVKIVFGGIIDIIMEKCKLLPSIHYLQKCMQRLTNGKFGLEKLTISKTLNPFYKNPDQIAHKVLAERIGERDPGNKPANYDRIPYVYIKTDGKVELQGDKIENPQYIMDNKLEPDYEYYITNQIMKPVSQIFALAVEELPGFPHKAGYYNELLEMGSKKPEKIWDMKQKMAQDLLFGSVLRQLENKRNNRQEITKWFTAKK